MTLEEVSTRCTRAAADPDLEPEGTTTAVGVEVEVEEEVEMTDEGKKEVKWRRCCSLLAERSLSDSACGC